MDSRGNCNDGHNKEKLVVIYKMTIKSDKMCIKKARFVLFNISLNCVRKMHKKNTQKTLINMSVKCPQMQMSKKI